MKAFRISLLQSPKLPFFWKLQDLLDDFSIQLIEAVLHSLVFLMHPLNEQRLSQLVFNLAWAVAMGIVTAMLALRIEGLDSSYLPVIDSCFPPTHRWGYLHEKSLLELEVYWSASSMSPNRHLSTRFVLCSLCHKKQVVSSKAYWYVSHAAQHISQGLHSSYALANPHLEQ